MADTEQGRLTRDQCLSKAQGVVNLPKLAPRPRTDATTGNSL